MHASNRIKRIAGIGLLSLALALSFFSSLGGQRPAHAEGGAPPDLTRASGEVQPTPTPTPIREP